MKALLVQIQAKIRSIFIIEDVFQGYRVGSEHSTIQRSLYAHCQILTDLSKDPVAMTSRAGWHERSRMLEVCPVRVCRLLVEATS